MAPTDELYSARVVNKGLQTAVQEFRHPDGRVITIVGLVHVAEPDYFAQVLKTVQRLEEGGATVYIEGVGFSTSQQDRESWPAEIQEANEAELNALDIQYSLLPQLYDLPWIYQGDKRSALTPYPDTWKASDSNSHDMALLLGAANMAQVGPLAGTYEHVKKLKEKNPFGPAYLCQRKKYTITYVQQWAEHGRIYRLLLAILRKTGVKTILLTAAIIRRIHRKPAPTPNGWMEPFVKTYRECLGALAALKDPGDVVLLWHPGHARALGRIIYRNGFVPQEPSAWLQATHAVEDVPQKPKKTKPGPEEAHAELQSA